MADRPTTCPVCSGARTLEVRADDPAPCPECDGSGWVLMSLDDEELDHGHPDSVKDTDFDVS